MNILLLVCIFCCFSCGSESEEWSTLEIRKLEEGQKPELDNAFVGDVVVFESGSPGFNQYNFEYHHSFSGELKAFHAIYALEGRFDKGFYRWKDDTTIVVKMIHSKTDSSIVFELFGNGPRSGMRIED